MAGVEHIRRSLLDHATGSMAQSIVNPLRLWLAAHPLLEWWLGHPLWMLTVLVVAIALLVGLFGILGRLTENIWLTLFKTLFILLRWVAIATFTLFKALVGLVLRRIKRATQPASALVSEAAPSTVSPDADSSAALQTASGNPSPTSLSELLTRLTLLHQQEETLIAEIKQLLAQNSDAS